VTAREQAESLLVGYVGLGMSCEFGLVQRYCGAEPLDLLRFGYMPLEGLIGQIDAGFNGFTDTCNLTVKPDRHWHEFTVKERTSHISLHTEKYVGRSSVHDVIRQEFRRLPRLARKLAQELAAGERFVVYCKENLQPSEIDVLHSALLRQGPVSLLAVTQTPAPSDVGCVVKVDDGRMLGYLDRVQPLTFARYPSVDVWLAILRLARRMFQDLSLGVGTVGRPRDDDFEVPVNVEAHLFWRAMGARRRGDCASARALFAAYRMQFPDPDAFGCEFDSAFKPAEPLAGP
jgi:hypothetical protein